MNLSMENASVSQAGFLTIFAFIMLIFLSACSSGQRLPSEEDSSLSDNALAKEAKMKEGQKQYSSIFLDSLWNEGVANYNSKGYAKATENFLKLIVIDEDSLRFPEVFEYLGNSYLSMEKKDSSKIIIRKGIQQLTSLAKKSGEEKPQIYFCLGQLYLKIPQPDSALAAFTMAFKNESGNQRYFNQLTNSQKQIESPKRELDFFLQWNDSLPNNAIILRSIGTEYYLLKSWGNARVYLGKFLKLVPTDFATKEKVANTYFFQKQYKTALSLYTDLLKLKKNSKTILTRVAESYAQIGELEKGRHFAKRALAIDNNNGSAHITLGNIYELTVQRCWKGEFRQEMIYYDKLVYQMAYNEYLLAAKDQSVRKKARQLASKIEGFLPVRSETIMNANVYIGQHGCYRWLEGS